MTPVVLIRFVVTASVVMLLPPVILPFPAWQLSVGKGKSSGIPSTLYCPIPIHSMMAYDTMGPVMAPLKKKAVTVHKIT